MPPPNATIDIVLAVSGAVAAVAVVAIAVAIVVGVCCVARRKRSHQPKARATGALDAEMAPLPREAPPIFISYYQQEMDAVFQQLLMLFKARGLGSSTRSATSPATRQQADAGARKGSVLVLALLSPNYFTSKFCRGELEAAAAAGVPVVPVFSGEHYVRKQILDLLNARSDPEKAAAVTAAFAENLIDVNNGDHADEVLADIDTKVIARFLGAE